MSEQPPTSWQIDAGHSTIQFKVKHLTIATVTGIFTAFNGVVKTRQEDFDGAHIQLSIDAQSLNTNNEPRDEHLKSDSFFDVQQFPYLTFQGTLHKRTEDYTLIGALLIRHVSRRVELAVVCTGTGKGRFGDSRAGFELTGQINRHDFGLTWGMMTETGGLVVGEIIKLSLDIELVRQEREVAAAG